MLCLRCQRLAQEAGLAGSAVWKGRAGGVVPGFRGLFCGRCGALLPAPDASEVMLEKLSQLARFGLASEAAPLLAAEEGAGDGAARQNGSGG